MENPNGERITHAGSVSGEDDDDFWSADHSATSMYQRLASEDALDDIRAPALTAEDFSWAHIESRAALRYLRSDVFGSIQESQLALQPLPAADCADDAKLPLAPLSAVPTSHEEWDAINRAVELQAQVRLRCSTRR